MPATLLATTPLPVELGFPSNWTDKCTARADGREAISVVRSTHPDVVVMDVRMPEMDGLEATRQIVADPQLKGVRILMLTTFEVDEYVFEALRVGASGFLLKDADPAELLRAIRVVAAGDPLLSPRVTRRVVEAFAGPRRTQGRRRAAPRSHRHLCWWRYRGPG